MRSTWTTLQQNGSIHPGMWGTLTAKPPTKNLRFASISQSQSPKPATLRTGKEAGKWWLALGGGKRREEMAGKWR